MPYIAVDLGKPAGPSFSVLQPLVVIERVPFLSLFHGGDWRMKKALLSAEGVLFVLIRSADKSAHSLRS